MLSMKNTFPARQKYFSIQLLLSQAAWKKLQTETKYFHLDLPNLENGQGMKYQVLAGPTFVVVFTVSGILMGYLADKTSR